MEKHYEEKDQTPTLIDGGQVNEAIVNQAPTDKGVFNTGITATQIEQVVDLPIPTTDDSGKVLKVDAEGKWELSTDAEGTVVIANPTLAGTEADLVGIQVGTTKYKVPEGMKVVELTDNSGTLSDSDYAKVSGDNCLIKYQDAYYNKHLEDSGNIYYSNYFVSTVSNGVRQQYININKSTKTYSMDNNIFVDANPTLAGTESSLTSLQVGSTKYKVGGSEVLAYEGSSLLPSGASFSGWTLKRAIKDGNTLWFVLRGRYNSTSSATNAEMISITLPSTLSEKIYRVDGTTCNNAFTSSTNVGYFVGVAGSSQKIYKLKCETANIFIIEAQGSLSANTDIDLEVSIPIFLDIGTVQQ